MLQVGVNYAQDVSVGVAPTVQHGGSQAALSRAHQQAHARVGRGDRLYDGFDSVAAVVIDHDYFIGNAKGVKAFSNAVEQDANVFCFA